MNSGPTGSVMVSARMRSMAARVSSSIDQVPSPIRELCIPTPRIGRKSVRGWSSGIPTDSEDTLRFAELTGVRPMIEPYPLARVNEAYARMLSGKAQFRVVLTVLKVSVPMNMGRVFPLYRGVSVSMVVRVGV